MWPRYFLLLLILFSSDAMAISALRCSVTGLARAADGSFGAQDSVRKEFRLNLWQDFDEPGTWRSNWELVSLNANTQTQVRVFLWEGQYNSTVEIRATLETLQPDATWKVIGFSISPLQSLILSRQSPYLSVEATSGSDVLDAPKQSAQINQLLLGCQP